LPGYFASEGFQLATFAWDIIPDHLPFEVGELGFFVPVPANGEGVLLELRDPNR